MNLPMNLPATIEVAPSFCNETRESIVNHIDAIGEHVHGFRVPAMLAYACALSGQNICIIGPPGEGKSMFARAMADAFDIGAPHFEWTLARTTTPDEIFGPVSLASYEAGIMERATTGKLPSAGTAFLDEVFKGSSAVLNSLLTMLNERTFDGAPVPLRFIVSASNELPEGWRQGRNGVPAHSAGDDLGALWDRYTVRLVHEEQPSGAALLDVLGSAHARTPEAPTKPLTDAALEDATRFIDQICANTDASFFVTFLDKLERPQGDNAKAIKLSTRRKRNIWRLSGAMALLAGEDQISEESVMNVWPALWSTEDQIQTARDAAALLLPPAYAALFRLADQIRKMFGDYSDLGPNNIERFKIGKNIAAATKELQRQASAALPALPGGLRRNAEDLVEESVEILRVIRAGVFV